jgi:DNA modification methylase
MTTTNHSLVEHDCRDLSFIPDASIHLVVAHPPAFGSFLDPRASGRFSVSPDPEEYLAQLDAVWAECNRALAPGGHLACAVSPVAGQPDELPLSFDVHARTRRFGLEPRRAIRWLASDRVELDEVDFYGRSNQPCADLPSDSQDVLVMRKPGGRDVPKEVEVSSRMAADFFATCSASVWLIPAGADRLHPQCLPVEVAERLIRMFSFVGDTVLDPFAGLGSTSAAAMISGRNSIAVEIEPGSFAAMAGRMTSSEWPDGEITITRGATLDAVPELVSAPSV